MVARVTRQGPQAPLKGDTWSLSVFEYEVLESAGQPRVRALIQVAHQDADVDDPGFAVGAVRRLRLQRSLPPGATLLWHGTQQRTSALPWFCVESQTSEP